MACVDVVVAEVGIAAAVAAGGGDVLHQQQRELVRRQRGLEHELGPGPEQLGHEAH